MKLFICCFALAPACVSSGLWTEWSKFGPCLPDRPGDLEAEPQEGVQSRTRSCRTEVLDGNECGHSEEENGHKQKQSRVCDLQRKDVMMSSSSTASTPAAVETTTTEKIIVPAWSRWGKYGACSSACGPGNKIRERVCRLVKMAAAKVEEPCDLDVQELTMRKCQIKPCPIDGSWSQWSDLTACGSADCQFPRPTDVQGQQYRVRTCSEPAPAHGGKPCSGPFLVNFTCFDPINCPTAGSWSVWSDWACDGTMHRIRNRICNDPPPRNGGATCLGLDQQEIEAPKGACVDPANKEEDDEEAPDDNYFFEDDEEEIDQA